ncbi:hypothetical protein ACFS27_00125 [Promicromonospora vindobonensis]|uniref:Uncharacterized protein n=2 Tax=Promicromonospora TaxID=43676 RepID=A0ABW5VNX9_9MICO
MACCRTIQRRESAAATIGDEKLVVDMLVGDLQRVIEYPKLGFAIEQEIPEDAHAAYGYLARQGFTSRLIAA